VISNRQKVEGTINLYSPCGFTISIHWEKWNLSTAGIVMSIFWGSPGTYGSGIERITGVNVQIAEQRCAIFIVLVAASSRY
jgi:hypothetical protein